MRGQSGTTSLRSILYMDEIFGYFPPTANPPSKRPLLTLLKQARAFGLGVVLATQNPVDLDYKGLSNAGTWLLGRLQTDRDKMRVLDGLEGVAATAGGKFNRGDMDKLLSSLGKRIFLLHNVNKSAPEVFETRWALSYLRGPLTRDQIKVLMAPVKAQGVGKGAAVATVGLQPRWGQQQPCRLPASAAATDAAMARPVLPPAITQYFVPVKGRPSGVAYAPMVYAAASMYYGDKKLGVDVTKDSAFLVPMLDGAVPVDWDNAEETELTADDLQSAPQAGAAYGGLPAAGARPQSYAAWRADFSKWLYRAQSLQLMRSPSLGAVSQPGESERDFRVRLQQTAREQADARKDELRKKYEVEGSCT